MEELTHEIAKVSASIERVEAEIAKVEEHLSSDGLATDDLAYWRKKEEQLRKKEEQLRKEKEQLREKELLLLQQQFQHGRPPLYPAEREAEMERKMDLLLERTAYTDRATPQYSAAVIGNQTKKKLQLENRFTAFEGRTGEASILSVEEVETLSKMKNEHQVVAFITPHLEKIYSNCDVQFVVFNSEEYKWIVTHSESSKYNEKPDLLICHPGIVNEKPPFNTQDTKLNQMREKQTFQYGVLSAWKLRDAIGLTCEAKLSIDDTAFGQVINYGAHLCFGNHGSVWTKLILFDKAQCWLIGVVKGFVSDVTTFNWCDEGSFALLRDFIRQSPLMKVLTAACKHFQLTVGKDSFLGAGAFGFVFRACRRDGRFVALKVVDASQRDGGLQRLQSEYEIMREAHEVCPHEVMGVEEDGFAIFHDYGGGALVMSEVGEHYAKLNPQSIVESLKTLHNNGIVHGDARLENVVSVDNKPVWIDFAGATYSPAIPMKMKKDEELKGLIGFVAEKFNGYNAF